MPVLKEILVLLQQDYVIRNMAYILHLVKNYNSFKYFQKQNATKYDVSQNRHMIFMQMAIVFDPSVQVQGLILLPFQRKMSGITFNTFSIFYFLICVMYNCSNCSRQKLFYQKILTHDLRNQQNDLITYGNTTEVRRISRIFYSVILQ